MRPAERSNGMRRRRSASTAVVIAAVAAGCGGESGSSLDTSGALIAFTSDRDGNWNIYVMDADGSNVMQVTDGSSNEILPAWAPNSG